MANAENEQPLLPKMRAHARQLVIEKGGNLLQVVHGEIYVRVEHRQSAVHFADTEE